MICPKCGASKVNVGKYAYPTNDEVYRRRRCSECNHIFFTCEFPVEVNDEILSAFSVEDEPAARVAYRKLRDDKIVEMFDRNESIQTISTECNVRVAQLYRILRKRGRSVKKRTSGLLNNRNEEIKKRIADGATARDIMSLYDMSENNVYKILKNEVKPRYLAANKRKEMRND